MRTLTGAAFATLLLLTGGCGSGDDAEPGAGGAHFPQDPVPSPELPASCATWMGGGVVAIVCDPGSGNGDGFSIALDGETSKGSDAVGFAQVLGEPLRTASGSSSALRAPHPKRSRRSGRWERDSSRTRSG